MKHTPGQLRLCNDGDCSCLQIWTADYPVAIVEHGKWGDSYPALRFVGDCSLDMKVEAYDEHTYYGEIPADIAKANAQRLVACWNACEGLNPEAVPDLLKVLQRMSNEFDNNGLPITSLPGYAKTALALAKP